MSSSWAKSAARPDKRSLANVGDLFTPDDAASEEVTPGSFNDEFVIRAVVTRAIRDCDKKREQIAEEMSELLGTSITKRALDSYTSESAEQNRFPAQYTRAFCHVTRNWELLRCVTQRAGLQVISKSEARLMELGRQMLIQKRAAAAIVRLEAELADVAL
jgi:hypothetical protein